MIKLTPFTRLRLLVLLNAFSILACNTVMQPLRSMELTPPALPELPAEGGGEALSFSNGLVIGSVAEADAARQDNARSLESFAEEQYSSEEMSQAGETYLYTIVLERNTPALWSNGWCATEAEILEQNFEHIQVEFLVSTERVPESQILVLEGQEGSGLYCRLFVVLVTDWPEGETQLTTRVTFDEAINDGLADYPAGTHEYVYNVTKR